jgi:hypothetical protein
MIGFIVAFLGTIILAVYGWLTYFSLRKRRKSVGAIRPLPQEKESPTVINKPNKDKSYRPNSGKP